ncbi:Beta-1,3-galactosyltransferase 5-like protein [Aphelenchoides fujianensis]|nr:Beta-1,3-galactosyltransferase 5-like protein [Aphelenchoides fujianensis]
MGGRRVCGGPAGRLRSLLCRRGFWIGVALLLVGIVYFTYDREDSLWYDPPPLVSPWMNGNERKADVLFAFSNRNLTYRLQEPRNPRVCEGVRVLVFVLTRPAGFATRRAIRKYWEDPKKLPAGHLIRFVVGAQTDYETEVELQMEQQRHADLVRYDARDSYRQLFVKTHALFTWQQLFCPHARWLVKADDDAKLDLQQIDAKFRSDFPADRAEDPGFVCMIQSGHRPFRNPFSKWYLSRAEYAASVFPDYCQGTKYSVSTATIGRLLAGTNRTTYLEVEDVYFSGVLADALGIRRHECDLFAHD